MPAESAGSVHSCFIHAHTGNCKEWDLRVRRSMAVLTTRHRAFQARACCIAVACASSRQDPCRQPNTGAIYSAGGQGRLPAACVHTCSQWMLFQQCAWPFCCCPLHPPATSGTTPHAYVRVHTALPLSVCPPKLRLLPPTCSMWRGPHPGAAYAVPGLACGTAWLGRGCHQEERGRIASCGATIQQALRSARRRANPPSPPSHHLDLVLQMTGINAAPLTCIIQAVYATVLHQRAWPHDWWLM